MKKLNIAVLIGGPSAEHEVSLASGKNVIENLNKKKYKIIPVKIDKVGKWKIANDLWLNEKQALKRLKELKTDVVFIALHGEYGEDGTVQQALERVGLKYTGSDAKASRIGINKIKSGQLFKKAGLLVPGFIEIKSRRKSILPFYDRKLVEFPIVIKPVNRGSSVGITILFKPNSKNVKAATKKAGRFSKRVMIQKYIEGREVTCGILGNKALPPTEIIPLKRGFFDYFSKYQPGASNEITPARLSKKLTKKIQKIALAVHKAIGARGFSRTDMILGNDGKIYVLEINTIPGLTKNSLIPKQGRAAGISFPKLLDRIIALAQ